MTVGETGRDGRFAGLRVLVAEDEALCAMEMRSMLRDLGCTVVGLVATAAAIVPAAGDAECALLDVNLRGERPYDAAVALGNRGVPVGFVTGYARLLDCPEELSDRPLLSKPFGREGLAEMLVRLQGDRT